jgi:hypothetical protein
VGIIQLDGDLIRELSPGALGLLEAAHDVVQRGGDPEVLLLEAQLLAALKVVVGVQNCADGLGALFLADGALVVTAVELLEVELAARRLAGPEPQVVGRRRVEARDGHVVRHGAHDVAALPYGHLLAMAVLVLSHMAVELDLG